MLDQVHVRPKTWQVQVSMSRLSIQSSSPIQHATGSAVIGFHGFAVHPRLKRAGCLKKDVIGSVLEGAEDNSGSSKRLYQGTIGTWKEFSPLYQNERRATLSSTSEIGAKSAVSLFQQKGIRLARHLHTRHAPADDMTKPLKGVNHACIFSTFGPKTEASTTSCFGNTNSGLPVHSA